MSLPLPEIGASRYAVARLQAHPEWAAELADPAPFPRAEMEQALKGAADETTLKRALRLLRQRVLLRTLARDLTGRASCAEVCEATSDLAEVSIAAALAFLRCEELVVVGMGKLGGRELNVSSDIDLVFVHPGEADEGERYQRAGRALIKLMSEVTEDGFAFRVDMRLRPYGDSGPLACNVGFLENYFITQGREWERYAWIKGRALSGATELVRELEGTVRPFVFRKYLDYGTLEAMRRLHAEVRRDVERRELSNHVKLGPGGIREIEFVAQALQLIRGGRDPELTVRPTLQVLSLLSGKGLLPEEAAKDLSSAYVFLRNVEHRLQYLDDAQRHDLPEDAEDQARVAAMAGFGSWEAFSRVLDAHRAAVTRHFQSIFAENRTQAHEAWPEHPRLAAFKASQRYQGLPAESKRRLDLLVPALARAAAQTSDSDATLSRSMDLVEAIASRAAYLALLAENPPALERVTRIAGASSWAADYVARHPLLLDELLDDRVLYAPMDLAGLRKGLEIQLQAAEGDVERRMNVLREGHQAQVFRLLAQDLAGLLTVERLADHLSALADLMLELALHEAWRSIPQRHRDTPRFTVVAYGKLGGKELGYASDLDIIFLYDDPDERAPQAYARLAQRLVSWLATRTASGVLFETDLQLRPSGSSGLMVQTVASFERYQEHDAWVWEHQALTRARYSAGDAEIGAAFEAIREKILRRERDSKELSREILSMREKMHAAHPNPSGLFDLKHDRGGMIDIEFAVQYLVLAHSHRFPELTKNLGNIALLKMAAGLGLLEKRLADESADAYREYRATQHMLRLNNAQYARVPPERFAAEIAAVQALWRSLFASAAA
jgi:glutamate-ammonia-ligase adenylyltransferase